MKANNQNIAYIVRIINWQSHNSDRINREFYQEKKTQKKSSIFQLDLITFLHGMEIDCWYT